MKKSSKNKIFVLEVKNCRLFPYVVVPNASSVSSAISKYNKESFGPGAPKSQLMSSSDFDVLGSWDSLSEFKDTLVYKSFKGREVLGGGSFLKDLKSGNIVVLD